MDRIKEIRRLAMDNSLAAAANYIVSNFTTQKLLVEHEDDETASKIINSFICALLSQEKYKEAATILWGPDIFSSEPMSVKLIWDKLGKRSTVLIMGAGAMGKSFSLAVWIVLDWLRDPEWTCVKVLSVNKEHALRNVFAHIQNLIKGSLIPIKVTPNTTSIQANDDDKQGIHLLAIPQGENGKGRLRGFHPVPRFKTHPQFGQLSRVRVILDEAEEIPEGVWEDVDNILITKEGDEHVKVFAATNPKDRNSRFGQKCTPTNGWESVDIETSDQWESREGWSVIRLDGAKCENVLHKRVVYKGLLTYEGYQRFLVLGDKSPEYYTMARGWFPEQGIQSNIIPLEFITHAKGNYVFYGRTIPCAAIDLAFEGRDRAVMTIGKFGKATSWINYKGELKQFKEPRMALQIESQFDLVKQKSLEMTQDIIQKCKALQISHEWLIVDRTGNGTGVHDNLVTLFGSAVVGLNFGTDSTDLRILQDEIQKASEVYDKVVTELFFAVRKYIEFDYLKFDPKLNLNDGLSEELTNRRFRQKGKLLRVESKDEYKARGYPSPDKADSLTLLVHLVRMRAEFAPMMLETSTHQVYSEKPKVGVVDTLKFINFNN